jgi:hypothetical protein
MLSSERSTPGPIPGCPPARRGCAPGKVASGGLSFFSRSKTYANPRPVRVWAGENAEGCIHSVMDHLDYGLSDPKMVLLKDGSVFLAGQIQAPMEPPTTPQSSGLKMMSAASSASTAWTIGSALTAILPNQLWIAIYGGAPVNYTYQIAADPNGNGPEMPTIPAVLSYVYQEGDLVEWQAEVSYTMPRNSDKGGDIPLKEVFPWTAGIRRKFPEGLLAFLNNGSQLIRGGDLKLTARYTRAGKTYISAPRTGIKILGENPARASVDEALTTENLTLPTGVTLPGSDISRWLKAIARQESYPANSLNQFATTAYGRYQVPRYPSMNLGGDGGMGIMQITVDSLDQTARFDWLWNWSSNVAEGERKFLKEKLSPAWRYPDQIRRSSAFQAAVVRTNAWRQTLSLPSVTVNVPEFTVDQVLADAARGYNGYNSPEISHDWQFGFPLHEFRILTHVEAGIGLVIDLNPASGQGTGDVIWDTVLGSERPKGGEPDYVYKVRARLGAN